MRVLLIVASILLLIGCKPSPGPAPMPIDSGSPTRGVIPNATFAAFVTEDTLMVPGADDAAFCQYGASAAQTIFKQVSTSTGGVVRLYRGDRVLIAVESFDSTGAVGVVTPNGFIGYACAAFIAFE